MIAGVNDVRDFTSGIVGPLPDPLDPEKVVWVLHVEPYPGFVLGLIYSDEDWQKLGRAITNGSTIEVARVLPTNGAVLRPPG